MESRISIMTLGVSDLARSLRFYRDGLGMPTSAKEGDTVVFFKTAGVCLALYPKDKLAADATVDVADWKPGCGAVTLAHNTRERVEVDQVIDRAVAAGGRLVKVPRIADWGGYSGYFADPDGHLWEVAWSEAWQFNPDGSLVID